MQRGHRHRWIVVALLAALCAWCAQASAQVRVLAQGFSGEPFGVGKIEIDLPDTLIPEPLGVAGVGVSEATGRVVYPAVERRGVPPVVTETLSQAKRPVLRILGQALQPLPGRTTVYFLFSGQEPLRLTVQSQRADVVTVAPRANPAAYRALLKSWWRCYTPGPSLLEKQPDYPPVVDNYLRSMLSRRLELPLPRERKSVAWHDQVVEEMGLAAGLESLRIDYQRSRFVDPPPVDAADQPLPAPLAQPPGEAMEVPADVEVEPLALRVPAECLYVRYGSFANFLWFQDTLAKWGGDFQNLVATRGLDAGTRESFEKQLAVQTSAMARLFGGAIVSDVAIVASDLFLREGGAYGLLFRARNAMLGADFTRQRKERVQRGEAQETKVQIAGREVSYLASPDGHVRSYYVADGEYHFVTSSATLARRFVETRSGKGSLGQSPEFRYARSRLPLSRDDTVFAYLSNAFFANLTGPHYRVEMLRRMQAEADIELVQLALLASAAERKPGDTMEQLIAGGFLPPGFGRRADGSRPVLEKGEVRDSLRGRRGFFLPVPDVPVNAVSRFEAATLERFNAFYRAHWQRLDPIAAAVKRFPGEGGRERLAIDVRMTPFNRQNYQTLMQWIGPADKHRLPPIPGDSISADVVLARQRVFGGLRFVAPSLATAESLTALLEQFHGAVGGYLGTRGATGLLGLLDQWIVAPPDPAGYSQGRFGLWRWKGDDLTVFSFHRDLLASVTPQLKFVEAERPAQVRVRAADLSDAKLTEFLNTWGYSRTRETSLGNLRLLHQMTQQLRVPGDAARSAAELLLNARLRDPLGGQYEYTTSPAGVGYWTSSALKGQPRDPRPSPPPGYQAPPLDWFRGLDLEAVLDPAALSAHVELQMQMPAAAPTAK